VSVFSGEVQKKPIEVVYDLFMEPIQLSSFVVLEFGVGLARLKQSACERRVNARREEKKHGNGGALTIAALGR
jgi:hypothetical protein